MNTPRTKSPVRYGQVPKHVRQVPDGQYRQGLHGDAYVLAIGRIATTFPLVEHQMVSLLEELLGSSSSARQVFFSIVSQNARITVMRSLLEKSPNNRDKGTWYDEVLDEFKSLSNSRNRYVHGLWYTHQTGIAFLSLDEVDNFAALSWRQVELSEVNSVYERLQALHNALKDHSMNRLKTLAQQIASQETLPPQPDEGTS